MTACVNKKHSRRVAAAVSASLVGALTLGAAPAVVLAEEAGVEQQFLDGEGAFNIGKVSEAIFKHGDGPAFKLGTDGVYHATFSKNDPVILDSVKIDMIGSAEEEGEFTINPAQYKDEFSVEYFERSADGKPAEGAQAITSDIVPVGKYVAKVTAVKGQYKGGVVYVPFDIDAIKLGRVEVVDPSTVVYNGEVRDFDFKIYDENNKELTWLERGNDYTVDYLWDNHDATDEYVTEVKDAGNYVARIKGNINSGLEGTVEISAPIKVEKLNLSDTSKVSIQGVVSASEKEPKNTFALFIEGKLFQEGDAIMNELEAHITGPAGTVWKDNSTYTYTLMRGENGDEKNITDDTETFTARKVAHELTFSYDGQAVGGESGLEFFIEGGNTFDINKVSAFAQDGTVGGHTIKYTPSGEINYKIYDASGTLQSDTYMNNTPGSYYLQLWVNGTGNTYQYGGQTFVKVTVWQDALSADAKAAVLYDVDGDTTKEVVSSINVPYTGNNIYRDIEVAVEDAKGNRLYESNGDYDVTFYNEKGIETTDLINAGTYTLKVTSSKYKLSGTTEMTITIGKMDISTVKSGAVVTKTFDNVGSGVDYLPWREWGYSISGVADEIWTLDLQYKDADGKWVKMDGTKLLSDVLKVTILKDGQEVKKIEDEGVYTVHFELRNADAQNNYVLPADITVTCIKDGGAKGDKDEQGTNHLRYADVTYRDYFADPVDWIAGKEIMTGYKDGRVFGSLDSLSRGQVACVLYNMATKGDKVDESSLHYSELHGWETGFSDVDGKAYYGKAIAWAAQAGVVNGYADGTFHADQAVTRQEFACMLANYAKKYGTYKAASADALDKMSDADQVAEFATESVAWAVENGIIGNSGYVAAGSTIIRADAACMVYNYAK